MTFRPLFFAASALLLGLGVPACLSPVAQAAELTRRDVIEDPVAPKLAPKVYNVTIVEFADYNCPVCRRMHPAIKALLAGDHKIRFVYRDWPIFGPGSTDAARAAIASQWQGKHAAFNDALMETSGKVDAAAIRAAARKAGVDWGRLQVDLGRHRGQINSLLARTSHQADAMGLYGTPVLIVGSSLIPGALDLAGLRGAVADARHLPERTRPSGTARIKLHPAQDASQTEDGWPTADGGPTTRAAAVSYGDYRY